MHGLWLGEHPHLVPQLFHVCLHLCRGGVAGVRVAVNAQIHQHGIPGGDVEPVAAQLLELLAEHGVKGRKVHPVIVRPALARRLAHQRLQLGIAARFAEVHIVDFGQPVEVQELIIDAVFQAVVSLRDQPGDRARDLDRAVILEHRDPLVALLHIEPVHELKGNDGRVDALFQVGLAEVGPLGGKLGVRLQQRHEVGRKGCVSSAGLGAHDALGRDLHQTQRLL